MITFGPVPSRRLGQSLGINNIPGDKICTYACIYCQVGATRHYTLERQSFYSPEHIFVAVEEHLSKLQAMPDYLTFVPNGEPTLDVHLEESISLLKKIGIPIAVITNASLLSDLQVCDALSLADWVSVKVDANDEAVWKKINRPHPKLTFNGYKEGLQAFASSYKGILATETLMVEGVNNGAVLLQQNASLIATINPATAYISIPTRPPAMRSVKKPDEEAINRACQIYTDAGLHCELLLGFEGSDTGFTGDARADILNMSAVHPIREETMREILRKNGAESSLPDQLVRQKEIREVIYQDKKFWIRNFTKR
ncbi:MAG: radical SAM protein [Synergistaceae bacterium]|jgi:wyosine [tRNA(Phe)-imidazoG37] synthetase (radical SAM superfamily)|nr:radical SAM protein [Synergistaceae bacterium]